MNEYLKAQNKTNESIINLHFSEDELARFSKSDYRWAENYQATLENNKALSNQLNSEHERMESLEAELLHLKEMAASSDNSEQSDTF